MQLIKFIIIKNPLVPHNRQVEAREFSAGKSLHDYIGDLQGRWIISHNGKMIQVEELKTVFPAPEDVIAICPEINGGGGDDGGKSVIRMVAMVALIAFTYGQGAYAMPSLMGAQSAYLAVAQAAVMIGGTLLINAILPPQMNAPTDQEKGAETYGIDGPKNTSKEGLPIPLTFGRHRVAGNIIGNYTELSGQTQFLNLLLNIGEGVIAGYTKDSLMLSGQLASEMQDPPEVFLHNGNDGQLPPENFVKQTIPYPVTIDSELVEPTRWTRYATAIENKVEAVRLDFTCTLFNMDNKKGEERFQRVDMDCEVRPFGSTNDADWEGLFNDIDPVHGRQGIIFDYVDVGGRRERFKPNGKPVTKVKVGSQFIPIGFPNRYIEETGKYLNHYSTKTTAKNNSRSLEAGSLRVNPAGEIYSSSVKNEEKNDKDYVGTILRVMNSELEEFDYGNVVCDGRVVGKYHNFHEKNYIAGGFNDKGVQMGSFMGRTISVVGKNSTSLLRFSFASKKLPPGRYEIRVRRKEKAPESTRIGAKVNFTEVNEISFDTLAYNHTALLSMRMRVTDRFRNIPNVTIESRGIVIHVWDEQYRRWVPSCLPNYNGLKGYSATAKELQDHYPILTDAENEEFALAIGGGVIPNHLALKKPAHMLPVIDESKYDSNGFYQHNNPAWIAWNVLTNNRYGAGFDVRRLDFYAFKEWAEYCTAKRLEFDGVFGERETVWDVLTKIFRVGRAVPVRMGTRYSVSIEKPKKPVMRFGQDNMIKGSFSTSWLSIEDRANEVEISYYDRALDYQQTIVKAYDEKALANGSKPIMASIELRGVVNQEQAMREARYILNTNKLVQMVTFEAPIEALACTIGDVVTVQHDMMEWGLSGKISGFQRLPDGRVKYKLDQEVNFDLSPSQWKMIFVADTIQRGVHRVKNHYGAYVALEGFNPSIGRITRVSYGNKEHAVLDVFEAGNGEFGVVLDSQQKISVGTQITLWDTDTVITLPVTHSGGVSDEVTTVSPWAVDPTDLQGFMLGHENFISREFTVRAVSLENDTMTRKLTCLEYSEEVFNDETTAITVVDSTISRRLAAVSDIDVDEVEIRTAGTSLFRLSLSWSHESSAYSAALVSAVVGTVRHSLGRCVDSAHIDLERGQRASFTITPIDAFGREGVSRTFDHEVVGVIGTNSVMRQASISSKPGSIHLSWTVTGEDSYRSAEIFTIHSGQPVLIGGQTTNLTSLNVGSITQQEILNSAEFVGVSSSFEFTHSIATPVAGRVYHYWIRTENSASNESLLVYAGSSNVVPVVSYNNVSVYRLDNIKPARPVGGSYLSPITSTAGWSLTPPVRTSANASQQIWVSTRAFTNNGSSDTGEWSDPTPMGAIAFYTVTMYSLSEAKPARPTGGTYDNPRPTGTAWNSVIPTRPTGDIRSGIWTATRRFASNPAMSETTWSDPSQIQVPNHARFSWTAYASNIMGANFSTVYDAGIHKFIGRGVNKTTETPSLDWREYEWGMIIQDANLLVSTDDRINLGKAAEIVGSVNSIKSDVNTVTGKVTGFETEMLSMGSDLEVAALKSVEAMLIASREAEERRKALYNTADGAFPQIEVVKGQILTADHKINANKAETNKLIADNKTELRSAIDGNTSLITSNHQAITGANGSIAQAESRVNARFGAMSGATVAASIESLNQTITGANGSIAQSESRVNAKFGAMSGATVAASISNLNQAITGTNGSIAQAETRLNAKFGAMSGATVAASIESLNQAITSPTGSIAQAETRLNAKFGSMSGATVAASIENLNQAITGPSGSIASTRTSITAEYNSKISASITDYNNLLVGPSGEIGQIKSELRTTSGSLTEVRSIANGADGKFEAQWGIKGTYGEIRYGVGLVNRNGRIRFAVQAEEFILLPTAASPDHAAVSPFTVINGVSFLNNAMINTAHIVKLFTDELRANVVTANNLQINGGSINVGNRFIVSSTGAVSVISGTGASRTEVTNDGIVVYNNGAVVARVGRLA